MEVDVSERDRLIHDLEVHQAELEAQNTELREMQHLLEESRARYADLYDFAPIAYCTLDRSGRIVEINLAGAKLLERDRADLVGRPLIACLAPASRAGFLNHLQHCVASRQPCAAELRLAVDGGEPTVVQVSSTPALDGAGDVVACRTVLTDVTERKRGE